MAEIGLSPPRPHLLTGRLPFVVALGGLTYVVYVAFGLVVGLSVGASYLADSLRNTTPSSGVVALQLAASAIPGAFSIASVVPSPLDLIPAWKGTDRVNILVLGIDQRDDERDAGTPARSDTLMVVSIDPAQKAASIISFPRDLWLQIPGLGDERINAAFRFGELRKLDGGGAGVAARTIEQNFGLQTQYYAVIDFRGFEEIVNTVGGVLVDVPRPLRDDEYPTDNYGYERVYFAPGPQLMDGTTALKYARTRHADSDFGRMARQQQVMLGVRDRALRLNMLTRLPSLLDQGMRTVQTNIAPTDILSLAKLASEIDTTAVGSLVVDNQLVTPFTGVGGASLQLPKPAEIRRAIQRALADPRMLREAARVEIVSSAASAQLAQRIADRLASESLQIVRRTVSTDADPEATTVRVLADKPRSLTALLRALGMPDDRADDRPGEEADVDIRVVMGRDLQPQ
ncbi:MAG: putative transcription regulator [Chloroflexi bacterium]|nr:putative transcription regulator [Chloroflexota bacterium]